MEIGDEFKQYVAYVFTIIVLPILKYIRSMYKKLIAKLASVIDNMERLVQLAEQISEKLDRNYNESAKSEPKKD